MAPLLHPLYFFVWLAALALGEASAGDRDEIYLGCLDTCADRLCGVPYTHQIERSEVVLTKKQRSLQVELERELEEQLTTLQLLWQKQNQNQNQNQNHNQDRPPNASNKLPAAAVTGTTGDGFAPAAANNKDTNTKADEVIEGKLGGVGEGKGAQQKQELQQQQGMEKLLVDTVPEGGDEGGDRGETAVAMSLVDSGILSEGATIGEIGIPAVDRYVHSPPWHLQAMGWDCESECGYLCMTIHVETRTRAGQEVLQYHGKWPFRRVLGIQELFASLFSAGNGLPHLYHVIFSQGLYNPPGHYMRFWLTLYPWVGINTWLWSTVFHARDVPWTEAADYFFALLNIFYVVWIAIVRIAGPPPQRRPLVKKLVSLGGIAMSTYYLLHISFMWFVKFDYGYNMKVALVAGVMHTGLWLRYQYRVRDRDYASRGALIIILLNAAILLEVGDFPPVAYRLLDAHAIWHLVTIPLMFGWYRFVMRDARHEVLLSAEKAT